jgi:hypothetical protein
VQQFLRDIPGGALRDVDVAAFDTRLAASDQGFGLRLLLRVIGYAAGRIASQLERKGGHLVTPAMGFIVEGKEGPLRAGEEERASNWARALQGLNVASE